jgi:RecB family exonuclease
MGKLTLSIDPSVVKRAKDYAARRGTSVSSLVEGYLDLVSRSPAADDAPVTPLLARLRAELKGVNPDPATYRRYLARKYRVTHTKTNAAQLRQATLILRRVAQGEADVRKGGTVPQEKVFKALRARLAGK